MNIDKWTRLAVLQERKQSLKAAEDTIKDEIAKLQEELLTEAMEEGVKRVTVKVGEDGEGRPVRRTVYMHRQIWAGPDPEVGMEGLTQAMLDAGLSEYVKANVNRNSLSAYVREFDLDKNAAPEELVSKLPEPLRKAIKVSEVYELRSTKA